MLVCTCCWPSSILRQHGAVLLEWLPSSFPLRLLVVPGEACDRRDNSFYLLHLPLPPQTQYWVEQWKDLLLGAGGSSGWEGAGGTPRPQTWQTSPNYWANRQTPRSVGSPAGTHSMAKSPRRTTCLYLRVRSRRARQARVLLSRQGQAGAAMLPGSAQSRLAALTAARQCPEPPGAVWRRSVPPGTSWRRSAPLGTVWWRSVPPGRLVVPEASLLSPGVRRGGRGAAGG